MTEFPCGAGSSFQSVVTENGKEYMGFHTELAVYGGHDKQLSQKELEALHRAIQDLPLVVIGRVHALAGGGTKSGWQAANRRVGQDLDASV
jgi:hypothetical protein